MMMTITSGIAGPRCGGEQLLTGRISLLSGATDSSSLLQDTSKHVGQLVGVGKLTPLHAIKVKKVKDGHAQW